jgi:hypothetical protein
MQRIFSAGFFGMTIGCCARRLLGKKKNPLRSLMRDSNGAFDGICLYDQRFDAQRGDDTTLA